MYRIVKEMNQDCFGKLSFICSLEPMLNTRDESISVLTTKNVRGLIGLKITIKPLFGTDATPKSFLLDKKIRKPPLYNNDHLSRSRLYYYAMGLDVISTFSYSHEVSKSSVFV